MVEKLIKDGQVAVIYSPGFGAGWSTWNDEHRDILVFDKDIAEAVLRGDRGAAAKIAIEKCGDFYTGGARDLEVRWLSVGSVFRINEYDGSESINVVGDSDFMIA